MLERCGFHGTWVRASWHTHTALPPPRFSVRRALRATVAPGVHHAAQACLPAVLFLQLRKVFASDFEFFFFSAHRQPLERMLSMYYFQKVSDCLAGSLVGAHLHMRGLGR